MRIRWLWLGAMVAVATLLSTVSSTTAAGELPPSEEVRGQHVFSRFCATCHGERGDGHGPNAFRLEGPAPRDFTRGAYKFRTTHGGAISRHADIMRTIAEGVPGTRMPSWKNILSNDDIDAVARYLERFSPRFADTPDESRQPVHLPEAPTKPFASYEIEAGRMLYITFKCWECHGLRGAADGPLASTLVNDVNQPVKPADFTRGVYLSGNRPEDLYRTIATGLAGGAPGTAVPSDPMPTFGGAVIIGREGIADLGTHQDLLDPALRARVTAFINALPTQGRIDALTDEQRATLGERRIWLLVAYVRSLVRPRTPLEVFLFDDPNHP
jgi:cytochrome c oxidase cbb3-type subunit 2